MNSHDAIPNRLPKAIIASIFFPIFGVVAIFYARRVSPKVAEGDLTLASTFADQAKAWIDLTLASAAVVWGTVLILVIS